MLSAEDIEKRWLEYDRKSRREKDQTGFFIWATDIYPNLSARERHDFHQVLMRWLVRGAPGYEARRVDAGYLIGQWRLTEAIPILNEEAQRMECIVRQLDKPLLWRTKPVRGRIAILRGEISVYRSLAAALRVEQREESGLQQDESRDGA